MLNAIKDRFAMLKIIT